MNTKFITLQDNSWLANRLLEGADSDFKQYLGFDGEISVEVDRIIKPDNQHAYWAVFSEHTLVGVVYVYDYKKQYAKCAIGYGLLPEFRGTGLTLPILRQFCDMLETDMGIIRIQADVEIDNKYCLNSFEPLLDTLGFKYECTADNYWGHGVTCKIYSRCVE